MAEDRRMIEKGWAEYYRTQVEPKLYVECDGVKCTTASGSVAERMRTPPMCLTFYRMAISREQVEYSVYGLKSDGGSATKVAWQLTKIAQDSDLLRDHQDIIDSIVKGKTKKLTGAAHQGFISALVRYHVASESETRCNRRANIAIQFLRTQEPQQLLDTALCIDSASTLLFYLTNCFKGQLYDRANGLVVSAQQYVTQTIFARVEMARCLPLVLAGIDAEVQTKIPENAGTSRQITVARRGYIRTLMEQVKADNPLLSIMLLGAFRIIKENLSKKKPADLSGLTHTVIKRFFSDPKLVVNETLWQLTKYFYEAVRERAPGIPEAEVLLLAESFIILGDIVPLISVKLGQEYAMTIRGDNLRDEFSRANLNYLATPISGQTAYQERVQDENEFRACYATQSKTQIQHFMQTVVTRDPDFYEWEVQPITRLNHLARALQVPALMAHWDNYFWRIQSEDVRASLRFLYQLLVFGQIDCLTEAAVDQLVRSLDFAVKLIISNTEESDHDLFTVFHEYAKRFHVQEDDRAVYKPRRGSDLLRRLSLKSRSRSSSASMVKELNLAAAARPDTRLERVIKVDTSVQCLMLWALVEYEDHLIPGLGDLSRTSARNFMALGRDDENLPKKMSMRELYQLMLTCSHEQGWRIIPAIAVFILHSRNNSDGAIYFSEIFNSCVQTDPLTKQCLSSPIREDHEAKHQFIYIFNKVDRALSAEQASSMMKVSMLSVALCHSEHFFKDVLDGRTLTDLVFGQSKAKQDKTEKKAVVNFSAALCSPVADEAWLRQFGARLKAFIKQQDDTAALADPNSLAMFYISMAAEHPLEVIDEVEHGELRRSDFQTTVCLTFAESKVVIPHNRNKRPATVNMCLLSLLSLRQFAEQGSDEQTRECLTYVLKAHQIELKKPYFKKLNTALNQVAEFNEVQLRPSSSESEEEVSGNEVAKNITTELK